MVRFALARFAQAAPVCLLSSIAVFLMIRLIPGDAAQIYAGPDAPPEVIAKTHNLTPTELRVLLAIVQVGGVPEVADTLGVAESTVQTHVKRLYRKTGTGRHADLVKLVASYSSPLAV